MNEPNRGSDERGTELMESGQVTDAPRTVLPPVEVFKKQVEAFVVERDLDLFFKYIAPDCVFRDMTEPAPLRGHAAMREYLTTLLETLEDFETKFISLFSDGAHVAAELEARVRYRGEGAAPEGTPVTIHYCFVDEIRDGLVHRETVYWDPEEVARQLPGAPNDGALA